MTASYCITSNLGQQKMIISIGSQIGKSDQFRCIPEGICLCQGIWIFHEDLSTTFTASGTLQDDIVTIDGNRLVGIISSTEIVSAG